MVAVPLEFCSRTFIKKNKYLWSKIEAKTNMQMRPLSFAHSKVQYAMKNGVFTKTNFKRISEMIGQNRIFRTDIATRPMINILRI